MAAGSRCRHRAAAADRARARPRARALLLAVLGGGHDSDAVRRRRRLHAGCGAALHADLAPPAGTRTMHCKPMAVARALTACASPHAPHMPCAARSRCSTPAQAISTLRTLAVGGSRRPIYADRADEASLGPTPSACSPSETALRVRALREMRDRHAAAMAERLGATSKVPRVVAVADAYGLSEVEASVRSSCNLICPGCNPVCRVCNPMCPGCNPMCPGCNPT